MGTTETIRNKAQELNGQLKEIVGELTKNKDLQAEGAFEKAQAQGRHEHVKDHVPEVGGVESAIEHQAEELDGIPEQHLGDAMDNR